MGLTLVTGGVRSGKSRFAEQLAEEAGPRVLYVATARIAHPETGSIDEEMAARIARHRRRRPPSWTTLEEARDVQGAVSRHLAEQARLPDALLLDCLTLLVSNWLEEEQDQDRLCRRAEALADYLASLGFLAIAVTNEVGLGVVPAHPLGRAFRDVAGLVNQIFARRADAVYVLWAGIPVEITALDARRRGHGRPGSGRAGSGRPGNGKP